ELAPGRVPDDDKDALDHDEAGDVEALVSLSPLANCSVRSTPGGPAASTSMWPLTSSGRLSGTKTKRPAVPLWTRSGVRSASQTARTVAAPIGGAGRSADG